MFDEVQQVDPAERTARHVLRWLFFHPWVWVLVLLVLVGIAASRWLAGRAVSEQCDVVVPVDLSIDAVIGLKQRLEAYASASDEAPLVLAPAEVGFLIGAELDGGVRVSVDGSKAAVLAAVPRPEGGCWNVSYEGLVEVHDGKAHLAPERLQVGSLDLGFREWDVDAEQIDHRVLSAILGRVDSLELVDGEVHVRLHGRRLP